MKKSILFVTGTRADFGKMEPLAFKARESGFDVLFFVTGMHMLEKYGLTKTEVHRVFGERVIEFINQFVIESTVCCLSSVTSGASLHASLA